MNNVLCMKWGSKYPAVYVNTLYAMVARNLARPFRFICLTDDRTGVRNEVECRDLPRMDIGTSNPAYAWRKLSVFSPELHDLSGPVLFLDLDLIVVEPLLPLFTHPGRLCIIENWSQAGQGIGNSSVFRFEAGDFQEVLERFESDVAGALRDHRNEQTYLSRVVPEKTWWPAMWCRSFKRHALPRGPLRLIQTPKLPEDTKILVFHGDPKPADAAKGVWPDKQRLIRPSPWILDYWRED
jgi:hypothetical protein